MTSLKAPEEIEPWQAEHMNLTYARSTRKRNALMVSRVRNLLKEKFARKPTQNAAFNIAVMGQIRKEAALKDQVAIIITPSSAVMLL